MISSKERIIEILESMPNAICDDCLSAQSGVRPRQQVNSICRRLSDLGKTKREKSDCPICNNIEILNFPLGGEARHPSAVGSSVLRESALEYGASERLDLIRREIIRTFNRMDPVQRTNFDQRETFSERLSRLQNLGIIPNTICAIIRLLNSFRNLAVYEDCRFGPDELAFLEEAWKLIARWRDRVEKGQA